MTYREVRSYIKDMDEEQLDMDMVVFHDSENKFFSLSDIDFSVKTDLLKNKNHPVLIFYYEDEICSYYKDLPFSQH